jgi:hypothetical protein
MILLAFLSSLTFYCLPCTISAFLSVGFWFPILKTLLSTTNALQEVTKAIAQFRNLKTQGTKAQNKLTEQLKDWWNNEFVVRRVVDHIKEVRTPLPLIPLPLSFLSAVGFPYLLSCVSQDIYLIEWDVQLDDGLY